MWFQLIYIAVDVQKVSLTHKAFDNNFGIQQGYAMTFQLFYIAVGVQ